MSKLLKAGFIGCGAIARDKHMPVLKGIDGVELTAFYNPHREAAKKSAEAFGTNALVYETVDDLLAAKDVDIVHICTPNNTHADLSIRALNAGKHVMVEKPMAVNAVEGQAMIDAAKQNGKKLTVAFQGRFRSESLYLKQLCGRGELGDIYFARAHAVRRRGIPNWGTYLKPEQQGGGCLVDIGSHALDLTLWLMGNYEVISVSGMVYDKIIQGKGSANLWGPWDSAKMKGEDAAFALIRMKNGAVLELECSWALNIRNMYENVSTLAGTLGGADLLDGLSLNGERDGHLYVNKIDVDNLTGNMYGGQSKDYWISAMQTWIDAINTDTDPVVKPEQCLVVNKIMDAIYTSAKTGREVVL
jgi:predicted dehydrogenase